MDDDLLTARFVTLAGGIVSTDPALTICKEIVTNNTPTINPTIR